MVPKHIEETSQMKGRSPSSKRTLLAAGLDNNTSAAKKLKISDEDDDDSASSLSTNSFYGKKRSTYITPLDRKARRESQESDTENFSHSSVDENDTQNDMKKVKRTKSPKKNTSVVKQNTKTNQAKLHGSHKPLSEIACGSPKSPLNNVLKVNPESIVSSDTSSKKFFKSRTPQLTKKRNGISYLSKKKQSSSASKMTQKGLKMLYKPASMKTKTAPSSPDIKWKKRSLDDNLVKRSQRKHFNFPQIPGGNSSSLLFVDSDSSEQESLDSASPILRRSPRKQVNSANSPTHSAVSTELFSSFDDSQTSPSRVAKHNGTIESTCSPKSQSSCTDSVLLLSELESESNASRSPG